MRPFVFINVAMSADGKLSTRKRRQVRISGQEDLKRVDQCKANSDAIVVGIGTVLADDPSLTIKSPDLRERRISQGKEEHPIRVVVDSRCRIPLDSAILHKGKGRRVVACSQKAEYEKVQALESCATIIRTCGDVVDLAVLVDELASLGAKKIMVEGGGSLIWSFLNAGLVDEISCFIGNMIIGGKDAPTLADGLGFVDEDSFIQLTLAEARPLDNGILLRWHVTNPHP
jgi:2,5-diamino-6-(ribosylamino)-4(3H)-pyrimidinone 5'-phosphate reductase